MAIELGTETATKQERSAQITRNTPARDTPLSAALSTTLVIQREVARRDDTGAVLSVTPITPAYVFTYADLAASPAVAAYVASCGAQSLAELMGREAVLYDALIAERKAAAAAADAAAAQAAADAAAQSP
jgi:hypothetical protein